MCQSPPEFLVLAQGPDSLGPPQFRACWWWRRWSGPESRAVLSRDSSAPWWCGWRPWGGAIAAGRLYTGCTWRWGPLWSRWPPQSAWSRRATPAHLRQGPNKHLWVNLQEEEWRAMMVAWTELGLPSGVWYFSRETLHNSSAIKSERNASLFLRSMTSCAPRGKIQTRFYFILCRYAWSIQNDATITTCHRQPQRPHKPLGRGVYLNNFIQKGV